MVHIDDAMPLPREELIGSKHRLYPGEGIIPVRQILGMLKRTGYQGLYAIELFNEDYWSSDPLTVARRAREAALKMLGAEEVL
jgi:2-keto-myo-inositol isomerase